METVSQFLAMGGYAVYVWPPYGLTAAVLGGMLGLAPAPVRAPNSALSAYLPSIYTS
jgi:heme exporter protein D